MSQAAVIDGKAFAAALRERVAVAAGAFETKAGRKAGLAVVLVGEDPASQVYVRNKHQKTEAAGMRSVEIKLPATTSEPDLLAIVRTLNSRDDVDGILVQLPLPKHLNSEKIIEALDPKKDVDGFHVINAGKLATGQDAPVPCTPLGCLMLLKDTLGDLSGARAVVLGRSNIVGKPMAQLLLRESCTVTICHSRTEFLSQEVRRGDILIAAIGKPKFVKGAWIKPGATVIDVGINRQAAPAGNMDASGGTSALVAKEIRALGGWGEEVYMIALTNQNSQEEESRLVNLHLNAYLVKAETGLDDVVKHVKEVFKTKK